MSEPKPRQILQVDASRCHGHARCLQEAPEVFGYTDDTNVSYVLSGIDVHAHRAVIDIAIAACPECAISWVDP